MCSPTLAIMAAGTALSAYGTIQQGQQAKASYKYQAEVAEQDAKIERSAAQVRADKIRRAGALQAAEARVSLAGSGVDVDAGTSTLINETIDRNTEADALTEILNGNSRGARYESEANSARISGKNAQSASFLSAAGQGVAGGANIYSGWKVASMKREA